jgi:HEPN domain-containing protein
VRVTVKDAREVSNVIVETLHPISVVTFGSVAEAGVGEDLDLLVVVDDESTANGDVHLLAYQCLKKFYKKFAIDPFIIPKSRFNEYYSKGSPFLRCILKEGKLLYMRNAVADWFKQAEEELNMAVYLLKGEYYKGACFHSQQSIGKSTKAQLLKKGWELEKTHSIERLIAIAEDYKIKINISDEDIVFVDNVYKGRYPAETGLLPLGEPSEADAQKIVNIAHQIFKNSKTAVETTG